MLNNDRVIQLKSGRLVVPLAIHCLPGWPGFQSSADIVCYTAIEFVDEHVLLAHCEYPGLNSLQITRVPIKWLYQSNESDNEK